MRMFKKGSYLVFVKDSPFVGEIDKLIKIVNDVKNSHDCLVFDFKQEQEAYSYFDNYIYSPIIDYIMKKYYE